tara:strand:- start:12856 stop:13809 length:954 start_codon:yes stop_codon:yes gene_type:complete
MNKICVVGCGYWGKNHISTLNKLGYLGAVVDTDQSQLSKFSDKYTNIKIFTSLNNALQDKSLNAFVIASPSATHYPVAREIIKSGKHVLVEKPLALSSKDAHKLIELAKKNRVNLMVGHVLLFHPAIIKMKELIEKNKIGKLQYIYSNRLNLGQVRSEENVFWSLAPHDISLFQFFTESYPLDIKAFGGDFLQKGIHDSTITMIEYPNNIKSHIFVSWLHPFKEHRLVIIGSEGMLTFEDSKKNSPLKFYDKKFQAGEKIPEKIDGPVQEINYEKKLPLTLELEYFIDHLDGEQLKLCNGESALDVIKILENASSHL